MRWSFLLLAVLALDVGLLACLLILLIETWGGSGGLFGLLACSWAAWFASPGFWRERLASGWDDDD